jgi:hypothetical protein
MARTLASIEKITDLKPIEGKDKIVLATVAGYGVIVQKDQFNVNDLCVYIQYDTILPAKPEFEFLRSRCYSATYNGFRIREMFMGGVYSSGIVFPLSILPSDIAKRAFEGMDVEKILDVQKYDPEAKLELDEQVAKRPQSKLVKYLCKYKFFRKLLLPKKMHSGYPTTVQKSDETNIQKVFHYVTTLFPEEAYYATEKLEGQSSSFMLMKKGFRREYRIYSHNVRKGLNDKSNFNLISKKLGIEKILRKQKRNYAIQGEIIGPGIQKNIYKLNDFKLFVYKVTDTDTGKALNFLELREFCQDNNLDMVPVIDELFFTNELISVEHLLEMSNGQSVLNPNVKREGLVFRSVRDQSIGFKVRSPEYLEWFSKGDKTI